MKKRILNYVMVKGVQLFTDRVPTRIIRYVMGSDIDHIKLRNDLNAVARIAASEYLSGGIR